MSNDTVKMTGKKGVVKMDKRQKVFDKSNGKCCICNCNLHIDKSKYNDNNYTQIDHIYPQSLGGSNEINNLRALCKSCNSKRLNRSGEKLLQIIVDSLEKSKIDYNERDLFLKDDINNGILSEKNITKLKDKIKHTCEHNIFIIDKLYEETIRNKNV